MKKQLILAGIIGISIGYLYAQTGAVATAQANFNQATAGIMLTQADADQLASLINAWKTGKVVRMKAPSDPQSFNKVRNAIQTQEQAIKSKVPPIACLVAPCPPPNQVITFYEFILNEWLPGHTWRAVPIKEKTAGVRGF